MQNTADVKLTHSHPDEKIDSASVKLWGCFC